MDTEKIGHDAGLILKKTIRNASRIFRVSVEFLNRKNLSVWHPIALLIILSPLSEDRAEHFFIALLLLLIFIYARGGSKNPKFLLSKGIPLFREMSGSVTISLPHLVVLTLLILYFGSWFPDLDVLLFGIGSHRNIFFHSGLIFLLIYPLFQHEVIKSNTLNLSMANFFAIGIASHLLLDTVQYGNVVGIPGSFLDRLWLFTNAIGCLVFAWPNRDRGTNE